MIKNDCYLLSVASIVVSRILPLLVPTSTVMTDALASVAYGSHDILSIMYPYY